MVKKVNYPLAFVLIFCVSALALIYTVSLAQPAETSVTSESKSISAASQTTNISEPAHTGIKDIEKLIDCIATVNPENFTSSQKGKKKELVSISLWCILLSQGCENYDFTGKMLLISENRLEQMYFSLFDGVDFPGHKTISFGTVSFNHNAQKAQYSVPVTGVTPEYTAEIIRRKEKKGKLKITADLIPTDKWTQSADGKIISPEAQKRLTVTLRKKNDGTYSILSVAKK